MIDLDLVINTLPIELNKSYSNLIESGRLKKVSFFMRRLMNPEKGESVYWVKNPSIKCFNSEFEMYPSIGVPNLKADQMFGTSAYFYIKNGVLHKISFQLIQNKFFARNGLQLFRSICGKLHGVPTAYGDVDGFSKFAGWEDNNSKLITELSDCGNHFFIHWVSV